ncbi:MAG: hypothetical protein COA82_02340 [Alkaliphilus sp.]|nr:MAG: hypothetical protein COA82_02340 [Alkaliphilus sp.]
MSKYFSWALVVAAVAVIVTTIYSVVEVLLQFDLIPIYTQILWIAVITCIISLIIVLVIEKNKKRKENEDDFSKY